MERGRSIEECLARYPTLARELEPLLRTALGLQQAYDVAPRPSFQRAALQRFLAAAAGRGRPLAAAPPRRRFSFGWRWAPAAVGAAALVAAIALAAVLALGGGGGGSPEGGIAVRRIISTPTEAPPAVPAQDIPRLVARLEVQLDQVQERVARGAVIPPEAIRELKDINQSLEQTLPAAPPEAVQAAPQIVGLLEQQEKLLSDAKEQNRVAPEAASDVDELLTIAGTIREVLLPTATPAATSTPASTETPASSPTAAATPEASATPTPASSPGPGAAGSETIIPLTPTPSP